QGSSSLIILKIKQNSTVTSDRRHVSVVFVSALRSIVLDYLLLPLLVDDAECVFVSVSLIRTDSLISFVTW
ncbi:hypothetical protein A2U01_0028088, partial [Trifolium medium]|nr:hypothetical protein [Trifolium medium]